MISAPVACTPVEGHGTPIARQAPGTRQFVFLALPGYSFLALSNAVEALRMANRIVGRPVYEWVVASLTGQSETASNGFTITPTRAIDEHLLEAASLMPKALLQRTHVHELFFGGNGGVFPLHFDELYMHTQITQIYGSKQFYIFPYLLEKQLKPSSPLRLKATKVMR